MKPILFTVTATLPLSPEEIARQILDTGRWPDFRGYWPIPGIRSAEYETRTPEVVGSRIRVTNLDASTHVEEIVEWRVGERLRLRLSEFSPPLSRLASRFVETWAFRPHGDQTTVTRSFEMHPKSQAAKAVLWCVSFFLKRAIARHLCELRPQP